MYHYQVFNSLGEVLFEGTEKYISIAINFCQRKTNAIGRSATIMKDNFVVYHKDPFEEIHFNESGKRLELAGVLVLLFKDMMNVERSIAIA